MNGRFPIGSVAAVATLLVLPLFLGAGPRADQHGFGIRLGPFFSRDGRMGDLVGVNIPLGDDFPPDEPGYGFDNVGEMLTLSPTLLDRYLAAADAIVRAAILAGEPEM